MWLRLSLRFFFSCIYQRSVSAGEAVTGKPEGKWGFISVGFSFPLRKEDNLFKKGNFQRPEQPLRVLCIGLADPAVLLWLVEHSGQAAALIITVLCTLNLSLAEAATCESDMRVLCFSYFLSWQGSGCPLPALFPFPRWLGKEEFIIQKSGIV